MCPPDYKYHPNFNVLLNLFHRRGAPHATLPRNNGEAAEFRREALNPVKLGDGAANVSSAALTETVPHKPEGLQGKRNIPSEAGIVCCSLLP
ncbi:hypothetical protein JTE90_025751 [Oedothorax gibbosus]|uniref:Uncharacterized protein n=1 Tax=Oedothorax gibbosus TaxID=931172 RepID=A0AAV6U660_9ARAC|nr:hypothetical protein JTE90_025751 [Oedothorax gibbosus]